MIALVDGDIVAYRSAASCEPTKTRPDREIKEVAILRAEDCIKSILMETEADEYKVFLSGSRNYRKEIYPLYKANRTAPVPPYLADVGEYLVLEWGATISDGNEADDEMGIEQSKHVGWSDLGLDGGDSVICSIDKDLHMVPGNHYNFVTGERKFVDEKTGLFNFYRQLVFGDRSDNIPGYDGKMRNIMVPPKFLEPVIQDLMACEDEQAMYGRVKYLYREEGNLGEEQMHINAQLLYIQKKVDDRWVSPLQRLEMV